MARGASRARTDRRLTRPLREFPRCGNVGGMVDHVLSSEVITPPPARHRLNTWHAFALLTFGFAIAYGLGRSSSHSNDVGAYAPVSPSMCAVGQHLAITATGVGICDVDITASSGLTSWSGASAVRTIPVCDACGTITNISYTTLGAALLP
jgi:hypothetical protein